VDLESILDKPLASTLAKAPYSELYNRAFRDLLLHSCLLPLKINTAAGILDVSAIGSVGTPASVARYFGYEDDGSGDIRFVEKTASSSAENLPGNSADHGPFRYKKDVLAGYEAAVSILLEQRAFLQSEAFLQKLRELPTRWIPRPTAEYGVLLGKMRHPSVLTDALNRDLLAAQLWSSTSDRSPTKRIISGELRDLQQGDIPYFSSTASTTELFDSAGKVYPGFFEATGICAFRDRLSRLEGLRAPHREAIMAALESSRAKHAPVYRVSDDVVSRAAQLTQEAALAAAVRIGEEVVETAHFVDGIPFWPGLRELAENDYGATVLMPTVYEGALGIGLFFAYLQKLCPAPRWERITRGVHRLTERLLRPLTEEMGGGAFTGLTGIIYANLHTSAVLDLRPWRYTGGADALIRRWSKGERECDLISGLAGAMVVLLRYHAGTGDRDALTRAIALRAKILALSEIEGESQSWTSTAFQRPLGGFAHGSAGVAWALALSQTYAYEPAVDGVIKGALWHEETFWRPELEAWQDARQGDVACFWCHGAAGIGLAAAEINKMRPGVLSERIMVKAKSSILRHGNLASDCLCHGNLGNAEFFRSVGDGENVRRAYERAYGKWRIGDGWACQQYGEMKLASLMCGLTGVGYQLLRFCKEADVPNVLLLEGPRRAPSRSL
jgi:type 2 lantibiotic biosynthesis protein LanM